MTAAFSAHVDHQKQNRGQKGGFETRFLFLPQKTGVNTPPQVSAPVLLLMAAFWSLGWVLSTRTKKPVLS
ncbi:MAG: hypothetical protein Q7T96_18340 [Methylobacter sp.]|nr:hypothetical protein [Methylobacter sp.]